MNWRLATSLASLMVCTGCGTGVYWHEIDLTVLSEPGGHPVTTFKTGICEEGLRKEAADEIQMHSADSNGVIRITHRSTQSSWVWQQRPAYHSFDLFIPDVSTNGYFYFSLDEASRLPWRGLRRGTVTVRSNYKEFDTWYKGSRALPALSAEVMPSTSGGYHVKMALPIRSLRAAAAAELVPYQPDAGKGR